MTSRQKVVLVTGAAGGVGGHVRRELSGRYDLRLSDIRPLPARAKGERFARANIARLPDALRITKGVDAIIHLGGYSVEGPWADILEANVVGCYNVFESARRNGVKRVLFASSNHAVGFYRRDETIDHRVPVRPDGRYGVSKVFGEAIGRYYADNFGMRVYCLRIGTLRKDDDPCSPGVAASPGWPHLTAKQKYERLRATWLSHRDCAELVACCLEAETVPWAVVYGISDNPRQFWDLRSARQMLGFSPVDRAPG